MTTRRRSPSLGVACVGRALWWGHSSSTWPPLRPACAQRVLCCADSRCHTPRSQRLSTISPWYLEQTHIFVHLLAVSTASNRGHQTGTTISPYVSALIFPAIASNLFSDRTHSQLLKAPPELRQRQRKKERLWPEPQGGECKLLKRVKAKFTVHRLFTYSIFRVV